MNTTPEEVRSAIERSPSWANIVGLVGARQAKFLLSRLSRDIHQYLVAAKPPPRKPPRTSKVPSSTHTRMLLRALQNGPLTTNALILALPPSEEWRKFQAVLNQMGLIESSGSPILWSLSDLGRIILKDEVL